MPRVTEVVQPKNDAPFAVTDERYNRGGFRTVADVAARDAIPADRRAEGMRVYVAAQDKTYRLASDLTTWIEIVISATADPYSRPYIEEPAAPATYYVETTGNDGNTGLSPAQALATVKEAVRRIAIASDSQVVIQLGAGSFDAPTTLPLPNWITIKGTEADGAAVTVNSVIAASDDRGIVIDVTGLPLSSADQHRGALIEFTAGAVTGTRCRCYRSDASVGALTRLYLTHGIYGFTPVPGALDTAKLITLQTSFNYTTLGAITTAFRHTLESLRITGNQLVVYNSADPVEYLWCDLEILQPFVARFGSAVFAGCYWRCPGTHVFGVLTLQDQGWCKLSGGTVIDASIAGSPSSNRWINVASGSRMVIHGLVAMRGLEAGIVVSNSDLIANNPADTVDSIIFEDGDNSVSPTCANGISYDGDVTQGELPHLYGEVASSYVVVTDPNSDTYVRIPTASNVRTATVPKAVSADGGSSAVSEHLHARITGGTPDVRRIIPAADDEGIIGETGRRWQKITVREIDTGDIVMRAPDGSAVYRFVEAAPEAGGILVHEELTDQWFRLALEPIDPPEGGNQP